MLYGEDGNDRMYAGPGTDVVSGGNGNDVIYALELDGNLDSIDCGPGFDNAWVRANEKDVTDNCEVVHKL